MKVSKHADEYTNLLSRFDGMIGDLSAAHDRSFCVPCYQARAKDCNRIRLLCDALEPIVRIAARVEEAALKEDLE